MSKQNKKLLAEIQNGLKQVDEGIAQLEMLEGKVENASTISIKEKYRQDMKREIKRLQRLRDIFRQNVNNPAIVESHRLVEARKRIETEMEKFRDHEKEYKSKRPTKAAMLIDTEIKGKFNYGSGSSLDGEYGEDGDGVGDEDDDDLNDDSDVQDIVIDKQWLVTFVSDTLRSIMSKYDSELDKIQNKKTKGGQKKNRDKINALKAKKSHFQHIKDRAEELQISMDYLDPGKIRQLRIQARQLNQNADDETVRLAVLQEIDSLIELSEQNRRSLPQNNSAANQLSQATSESGRVSIDQLDVAGSEDIVDDDRVLSSLRIGNILDAQDYLGTWHLSIVIDDGTSATSDQLSDTRTLHFLPFMKANRDEVFSQEDQARLAPAFSKQEASGEPQTQLQTLQTYLENHLRKTGQNPATIQQNKQMRLNQQQQAKEESKGGSTRTNKKSEGDHRSQKTQNSASQSNASSSNQAAQNAPTDRNTNGSGLQLQKVKVAAANTNNPLSQQQQKAASLAGGKSNQEDIKNRNRMASSNAHQADQALYHGSSSADVGGGGGERNTMGNGASQAVQLKSAASSNAEDSGMGTMPQQQQQQQQPLFQDMPAFGSGQFLYGTSAGEGRSDKMVGASEPGQGSSVLLQNHAGGLGALTGMTQSSQTPQAVKDTSLSERKHNLDLLETSFKNILMKQDQEVIDPKQPVSVWEEHDDYPKVPLFNRKENFSKFDLETLFFAFYYQQGTCQQYLAAVELKKKNWKFVKKFETWFKKLEGDPKSASSTAQQTSTSASSLPQSQGENGGVINQGPSSESEATKNTGANAAASNTSNSQQQAASSAAAAQSQQKDVGKYIFFDFENGWQQLVRDDFELDLSQIENELVVQPAGTATLAAGTSNAGVSGGVGMAANNPVTAATTTGYTGAQATATNAGNSGAPSRTTHQQ